ncbi:hypothetical protein [Longimicrobium sp.]|uniref:hypothetical protein n=1 Tax=Longimicrobium sp. TaxID=2029185 RepID=UPI003B3A60A8
MRIRALLIIFCAALAGCRASLPAARAAGEQDAFWASLQRMCGQAYAGTVVNPTAADTGFVGKTLVMHVRQCAPGEIRIPFHVGENRSRTWILTRTDGGLRLKHDHRHEDGGEDAITQYGGDTRGAGTPAAQEFYADAHTATLIPAAVTNVWTMEVIPGQRFAYALRREGTDRRFRVEFDLTRPVAAPPAPWGY